MHDPFQNYATMGSPYGAAYGATPYQGSPYGAQFYGAPAYGTPGGINPITGIPQTGQQGFGINPVQSFINPQQLHPHHLQLASALAAQAGNPQLLGYSPLAGLQNPMVAALLTNPLIAAGLQSQLGLQQHSPYSQFGQPGGAPFGPNGPVAGIGYPLAPQSWVGQAGQLGAGQPFGQIHPLLVQLTARSLQGQGVSPWGY